MTKCEMKRSRECMDETIVAAQNYDSIDFVMPTGRPAWRTYEARNMIASTSARSMHYSASQERES
jgi:hypothetical protein